MFGIKIGFIPLGEGVGQDQKARLFHFLVIAKFLMWKEWMVS